MADPLTILTAAAQFIGIAGQAAQGVLFIRQMFRDIKGAPKLIKDLHHELRVLEDTLLQLSTLDSEHISNAAASSLKDTVTHCFMHAEGIGKAMLKFEISSSDGSLRRVWKQFLTSDKKSELMEHLNALERSKTSLLTGLATIQVQITGGLDRKHTEHAERIEQSLDRMQSGLSTLSGISESTYTNTIDIKATGGETLDIVRRVDMITRQLQREIPAMLEDGIRQCLDRKLLELCLAHDGRGCQPRITSNRAREEHLPLGSSTYHSRGDDPSAMGVQGPGGEATIQQKKLGSPQLSGVRQNKVATKDCNSQKRSFSRTVPLPIGFLQTKTTQRFPSKGGGTVDETETVRVEISLIPFRWLSAHGRVLTFEKVYAQPTIYSWNVCLHPHTVVPDDAMVLRACAKLDVDALQKLFEYKQASPYDVDSNGTTLMAHALVRGGRARSYDPEGAFDVIKFLISQGGDPTAFIDVFFDEYRWFADQYAFLDGGDWITDEADDAKILQEMFDFCVANCSTDPFSDLKVLRKLYLASLCGATNPPLDSSYLFQDTCFGLDELVFEEPDLVFCHITDKEAVGVYDNQKWEFWQRANDQRYKSLVYLCDGGLKSIKSKVFAKHYACQTFYRKHATSFCAERSSHLLSNQLFQSRLFRYNRARRKYLREHMRRMLLLLLQSGEDPHAHCSCRTVWQSSGKGHRTVTDLAGAEGFIDVWFDVLLEMGYDALTTVDEWRFDGFAELFAPEESRSSPIAGSLRTVGSALLSGLIYIV